MKKKVCYPIWGMMFLLLWGAGMVQAQNAQEWGGIRRYAEDNKRLTLPAKNEKRVVFLGNSITEGWFAQDPDFFKTNNYLGRGVSGHTSYQFLVRFRQDVIDLHPRLVVINAGTNDVAENSGPYVEDYTFGNIVSMVELAQANKIKVILTSVLPAAQFGWNRAIKDGTAKIKALNNRIQAYAKTNKIPYVDYYSALKDAQDALDARYSGDGVHPNLEGYHIMETLIKPVIDKIK